ncbi:MAG: prepilin-type N-terminal cleavage/methylation domain-containing protein [Candidatus Omnitrophota bacterium]
MYRSNKKGLTLIELVISSVLIATITSGVIAAFVSTRRFLTNTTFRIQASLFAKEAIDTIRANYKYSEVIDGDTTLEGVISGIIRGNDLFTKQPNAQMSYHVYEPDGSDAYKAVQVTIAWDEAGVPNVIP